MIGFFSKIENLIGNPKRKKTYEIFHGNPACVVPLKEWLPDEILLLALLTVSLFYFGRLNGVKSPFLCVKYQREELYCQNKGERVIVAGKARTFAKAQI
ncbi:hypothetical protein [Myroides fluvii]|uniref:hypothetical protein n=1 Tax=Myroides fluvii TaxID=2572594 RepID=UPI001E571D4D|nr:hypothetical protein [Myroides fluvii]